MRMFVGPTAGSKTNIVNDKKSPPLVKKRKVKKNPAPLEITRMINEMKEH